MVLLAAAGCTPTPPLPETLPADEHRHRVSLRQLGRHLEQARTPPATAATRR